MRRILCLICLIAGTSLATAQSDTLPSAGSTAGVSISGFGHSIPAASLTPTGPRTPPAAQPSLWRGDRPEASEARGEKRRRP